MSKLNYLKSQVREVYFRFMADRVYDKILDNPTNHKVEVWRKRYTEYINKWDDELRKQISYHVGRDR